MSSSDIANFIASRDKRTLRHRTRSCSVCRLASWGILAMLAGLLAGLYAGGIWWAQ